MVDDFSSLLTIEVIDHGENDRQREGARCSVCLQSPLDVPASLPRCGHGVCQSCLDLVKRDDSNVFCVICQIRSVSPNPDHGETSTESWQSRPGTLSSMLSSKTSTSTSSPSMSNERQDIVKTQLMKLQHLDDAVYKPLGKHFEKLLLKLKKGLDKNVQLVETRFEELVDALDKRKKKIIRSLKQNTKANKAMVENKKKAMEKERAQLRECRRRHQDKLRLDGRSWQSSDTTINLFLLEADDFQRKARKMSTENSITEFDELEVITNAEEEGSIKTAIEKLITLRETTQLLKSRVGTPPSSVASSIEESTRSSYSFSSDEGQLKSYYQRGRPMSLRVPVQPSRTRSLSPNPPCFPRVPVTPRDVRSSADGCEIQDLQTAHFLPDIAQPPSPTAASGSQRPDSGRRRQPVPPEQNDAAVRERSLGDHPGCRFRSSDKCLLKRRDGSIKRLLPDLSLIRQNKGAPQSHRVKYQTLMLDDVKLQRPCGICCLSNGEDEKGVVTVADCGQGQIVNVDLDGQVTGVTAVWEQDDDSVKADGIFDVAQMDGDSVIVSDSHQKEVILFDKGRRLHSLELPANTDPRGVTSQGHRIFICDQGNHCVQMLDLHDKNDCKPISSSVVLGKPNEHDMVCPYFVSVDRAGERILVSDYGNGALILARTDNAHPPHRVKLVASSTDSKNGRPYPTTKIEIRPTGVAWLPDGHGAVVADQIGHRLVVVDEELKVVGSYGRQGSGEGEFLFPHGISFLSDSILSVCDMNNARIQFVQLDALHANLK